MNIKRCSKNHSSSFLFWNETDYTVCLKITVSIKIFVNGRVWINKLVYIESYKRL